MTAKKSGTKRGDQPPKLTKQDEKVLDRAWRSIGSGGSGAKKTPKKR